MCDAEQINADRLSAKYGSKATAAQVLATLAHSVLLIGLGMEMTMPGIVVENLMENAKKNTFSLTLTETSLYVKVLIFSPVGCITWGFLQDFFGRKRCSIVANTLSVFGWMTLYFANSSFWLFASTAFMGLGTGFNEPLLQSYVGEISEPRLRATLSALTASSIHIGMTCTRVMAYLFDWRTVALLSTLCPIACTILVTLVPESPIWLISKGKNENAERSLCWLRGWVEPEKIKAEHLELVRYTETSRNKNGSVCGGSPSFCRPLRLLMIVFAISCAVCFLPARISFYYHHKILNGGVIDDLNLILCALQIVACLILVLTIRCLGKRFMALATCSINTILIFSLTLYVVGLKNNYIVSTPWVPLTMFCGINIFGVCFNMLPWMLVAELFPNKSRGVATGLCAGLTHVLMFILTTFDYYVSTILTLEYSLILLGSIGIFGLIYLYICLPETESKTLLEIEELFS